MNIGKWFIILIALLAVTGAALAESNDTNSTNDNSTTIQGQALTVRYDQLQCKVAFTNTQIDLLNKYISVDQTANKDKLLADMTSLKTYVDNIDKDSFDNYSTQTVRPDLQNATQDLNNAKKNFKQYNVSNESRTAFINGLNSAKTIYSSCIDDKEIKMAKVVETHMENWSTQWKNIADNMAQKNITIDDAKALLSEIEAKNAELSALITSGNITQISDFMKAYHEDQLHYAARFEVARLKGYRDKLAPIADQYNMSDALLSINKKIIDIENYTRPGHNYTDNEFKNTWNDIKSVGQDMKNAAKDINAERTKERMDKLAAKQQKINDKQQKGQGRQGHGLGSINNTENSSSQ